MANVGPYQLLIIAVVLIVLFGAKKLPDAARSLGRSMRIFKSEIHELNNDTHQHQEQHNAGNSQQGFQQDPQQPQQAPQGR